MSDLEQRVAAGAALLDRERPGWWEEVDTERLEMISPCRCVLGQLHNWYSEGVGTLHGAVDIDWASAHGFTAKAWANDPVWVRLDRLWLAAIAERRARAESVGPTP